VRSPYLSYIIHFISFRTYLRTRDDTIKCIINSLIDDGPSELAEELAKGDKSSLCDTSFNEEDLDGWQEWVPDPIDADSCKFTLHKYPDSRGLSAIEGDNGFTKIPQCNLLFVI